LSFYFICLIIHNRGSMEKRLRALATTTGKPRKDQGVRTKCPWASTSTSIVAFLYIYHFLYCYI